MNVHKESAFESNIETHLIDDGWDRLDPKGYDRSLGLFGDEVISLRRREPAEGVAAAGHPARRGDDGAAEVPQGRRQHD